MSDNPRYQQRKAHFDQMMTLYGRNPVLEAVRDRQISVACLHLAEGNRPGAWLKELTDLAAQRDIPVRYHSREQLARISKNRRQDQGVAVDLQLQGFRHYREFFPQAPECYQLLALDRITNPQNLGMIIRAASAAGIAGILWPQQGCAPVQHPLVIKASAGAVLRAPIWRCEQLGPALQDFQHAGAQVVGLAGQAERDLFQWRAPDRVIYTLGNETEGLSTSVQRRCDQLLRIPMANGVESLNVATTAALLAFASRFQATLND